MLKRTKDCLSAAFMMRHLHNTITKSMPYGFDGKTKMKAYYELLCNFSVVATTIRNENVDRPRIDRKYTYSRLLQA
jgi:hypothetical protein